MTKTKQALWGDYRKLSDEELLHRYASKHEHAAINCLFDRYGHLVFGVCIKYLKNATAAKRATEQIFTDLLDQEPQLLKIEKFKPWLYEAARNHCTACITKSPQEAQTAPPLKPPDDKEDWQNMLLQDNIVDQLAKEIVTLNDEQRRCIEMFYLERQTFEGIAKRTNLSVKSVKETIQQGRENLKLKLGRSGKVKL